MPVALWYQAWLLAGPQLVLTSGLGGALGDQWSPLLAELVLWPIPTLIPTGEGQIRREVMVCDLFLQF